MPPEGAAAGRAGPVVIRMVFCADPMGVRAALERIIGDLEAGQALPAGDRGAAQIVLAEALNNIVEHAYAERGGEIDLILERAPDGLRCAIHDRGEPLPGNALPAGAPPQIDGPDLPEGGFGWFLIRSLARDLAYDRVGGRNRLSFRLPTADIAGA